MRGDCVLIRVPAFDASGTPVRVAAGVLNQTGQPMFDIDPTENAARAGVSQLALTLWRPAPGTYQIEVSGMNGNGAVREHLAFRVVG